MDPFSDVEFLLTHRMGDFPPNGVGSVSTTSCRVLGSVMVPGDSTARRVAARMAVAGSVPLSFADLMRLQEMAATRVPRSDLERR